MLILVLAGANCTNSGLGKTDSGGSGDTGEPSGTLADCPWVGTWTLDVNGVYCSTFPYDDWYDAHSGATLTIDHDPDGGCAVEAVVTGATCERTEDWSFTVPVGTSVDVTFGGISDCDPTACTFDTADVPCAEGDLANGPQTLTIDESNGSMQAVGLLVDTATGCPLDVVTHWSKE